MRSIAAGHVIEAFASSWSGQLRGGIRAVHGPDRHPVSGGSARGGGTAEVTARFTLDAMPGKQMAIDADLNAGLINEGQARARREQIARDAEFYGAMDGAAASISATPSPTILITAIILLPDFSSESFSSTFLSRGFEDLHGADCGDGLVTMIPSLLVSMRGALWSPAPPPMPLSPSMWGGRCCRGAGLNHCRGRDAALAAIRDCPSFLFFYWLRGRDSWPGAPQIRRGAVGAAAAAAVAAGTRSRARIRWKIC